MATLVHTGKDDSDYLKYYRIIFRFVCVKHGFNTEEMDSILFLRHEGIFTRKKMLEFTQVLNWKKNRIRDFLARDVIKVFDKRQGTIPERFVLSRKAKNAATDLYKFVEMRKDIPMSVHKNPLLKKSAPYSDKVYLNAIIDMQKVIKESHLKARPHINAENAIIMVKNRMAKQAKEKQAKAKEQQ